MEYFIILLILLGLAITGFTLAGTIELLLLTLGGLLFSQQRQLARNSEFVVPHHLAVVIPAHNEEANIACCITSLLSCDKPNSQVAIYVIADNCTDETARCAQAAGAQVLTRQDEINRGKGYALDYVFQILLKQDIDAILIIDADTVVEKNFFLACEQVLASGAEAIQCRYTVSNPDISLRTRLMHIALLAFNVLRPRGRAYFGVSVGILGNGFGLTRRVLQQVPYQARSVVEDLEYHLALVRAGMRVHWVDSTTVRGDMPTGGQGTDSQRARWEGGRLRMILEQIPILSWAVLTGQFRLLEPLLELLLLPLALHVTLLLLVLLIPFPPTQIYAGIALGIVLIHILAALWVGGGTRKDLAILASVPFYILWKLTRLPLVIKTARKEASWVRTQREHQPASTGKTVDPTKENPPR
jgi:cellulose synthase/poly-beta-1,6-N-acetylglucosamine synthase-like glycosyltransferase